VTDTFSQDGWYVVRTHALSEDRAAWHLKNRGFDVYLPRYSKQRRHACPE
jgi:hypothetical protein